MPAEAPFAVHASAVAIGGRALLLRGPSRAGKSTLAHALIAAGTPRRPIALIGDDRVLLSSATGALVARPHPRVAGFMERRGLGIVAMGYCASAPVAAIVALGPGDASTRRLARENFPVLDLVDFLTGPAARREAILLWWDALFGEASATHLPGKASRAGSRHRKD